MPLMSPWGPAGSCIWWKLVSAFSSDIIEKKRAAMRAVMPSYPKGSFSPQLSKWIQISVHPLLDVFRMIMPMFLFSLRPMYCPGLSSNLYLQMDEGKTLLINHAGAFANGFMACAFNQSVVEKWSGDFEALNLHMNEDALKKLGFDRHDNDYVETTSLSKSLDDLHAWQFPTVSKANFISHKSVAQEGLLAILPMVRPLTIKGAHIE
jgi:hypothetical protein